MTQLSRLAFKIIIFLAFYFIFYPSQTLAAVGHTLNPSTVNENTPTVTIEFNGLVDGKKYYVHSIQKAKGGDNELILGQPTAAGGKISITACGHVGSSLKTACGNGDYFHGGETYKVTLSVLTSSNTFDKRDELQFIVERFMPEITLTGGATKSDPFTITIKGSRRPADNQSRNKYAFDLSGKAVDGTNIGSLSDPGDLTVPASGTAERKFGPLSQNGAYTLDVKYSGGVIATFTIKITDSGSSIDGGITRSTKGKNPCGTAGCPTAIGNIPTNIQGFAGHILTLAIGLAGGLALILMVIGSIRVLTSSGDQQKLAGGRDMIVAAVAGLLFLIFSVLILKFIGVSIIGLSS